MKNRDGSGSSLFVKRKESRMGKKQYAPDTQLIVRSDLFMGDEKARTFTVIKQKGNYLSGRFGSKLYRIHISDIEKEVSL